MICDLPVIAATLLILWLASMSWSQTQPQCPKLLMLTALLVGPVVHHWQIRSYLVAGTLASVWCTVILHTLSLIGVANTVGWTLVSLVIEAVLGCTLGFSIGIPVLLARSRRGEQCSCHECSYNFTGNETGVCPECGAPGSAKSVEPTPPA
jgi:hypothetical protein